MIVFHVTGPFLVSEMPLLMKHNIQCCNAVVIVKILEVIVAFLKSDNFHLFNMFISLFEQFNRTLTVGFYSV